MTEASEWCTYMQVLAVLAASSKLCKEASSSYYIEGISKEKRKDCQKTAVMAVRLPYSLKFSRKALILNIPVH